MTGLPSALLLAGVLWHGGSARALPGDPGPLPRSSDECAAWRVKVRADLRTGYGDVPGTLRVADHCAALAGLSDAQRVEYVRIGARLRVQLGDPVGGEKGFRRALELKSDDSDSLFGLAQLMRGQPQEGVALALRAARSAATARKTAAAYRLAGDIQLDADDAAGARESYARALKLAGDDLYALRGMVLALRSRPREAAVYAARAQAAADAAPVWLRSAASRFSAHIDLELDDSTGAVKSFLRALETDPNDQDSLDELVQLKQTLIVDRLANAARPAEKSASEAALLRELKADPASLVALYGLSALRRDQKRLPEAAALAERFLDAVPEAPEWQNVSAYRAVGLLWLDLGNEALARQSIRYARDLDPNNLEILRLAKLLGAGEGAADDPSPADAYVGIARARVALGDPAGAERSLNEALKLNPDHLEALNTIAQLMLSVRRPREALAYSDRLIRTTESPRPKSWELAGRNNQLPWEHSALYVQRARILLDLDDEPGARASVKKALALLPGSEAATAVLAEIAQRKERKRIELEALASASPPVEPLGARVAALVEKARDQHGRKDDAAARASLARALSLSPDDLQALEASARLESDLNRPKEALSLYERIVKASAAVKPAALAEVHMQRARLLRELGDAAGEKASLERALALAPDHAQALAAMFRVELQERRPESALAYAEKLLKASERAEPAQLAAAYRQRATARLELKDAKGAQEDLKRALKAAPEDLTALWMALAAESLGPREALAFVEASRPASPGNQGTWLALRGQAYSGMNDRARADEDFRSAARSDPGICAAPIFQERRDRLDLAYFDRCVELFPQDPTLFTDRGVARYLRGQAEGAVSDFRRAATLRPESLEASMSLASALSAQNRPDEALKEADRAAGLAKGREEPILEQIRTLQRQLRAAKAKSSKSE